jgi:Ca2+-binding RTX toxin-like protein
VNEPPNPFASLDPGDPDGAQGGVATSVGDITAAADGPISAPSDGPDEIGAFDAGAVQPLAQPDASLIHLDQFRADPRFAGINGQGQTVVVLDTGVNLDHPFFGADADHNGVADRIVYSYDFTGANSANANDGNGHGSNVASIVGSQDATYTGMAPGCNIIALKVLSNSGSGTFADIEEALQWVVANRAAYNIVSVNLSLGDGSNLNSPLPGTSLGDEIATLHNNDVAVVCASGNSYYTYQTQGVSFPSSDPNAWSVGAVWDRNVGGVSWTSGAIDFSTGPDRIISFSQRSTAMTTIFAPGGFIGGAARDPGSGVSFYSGTSQATPHISGLVADMQQLAVQISGHLMSVDDLRSTMVSSAAVIFDGDDENDNVVNTNAYYGRVDAEAWGIAILNQLFAGTASSDTLHGTVVSDSIHGQAGNDSLAGNGGTDTLFGDAGDDVLDGGAGADTMVGGAGNDTYMVDNAADVVIENVGEGTDTINASVSYSLPANVEILVLTGAGTIAGTANSGSNTIVGNSAANVLDGGVGADTMSGGAGDDIYMVDNAADAVIENVGEGTDTIYAAVSYSLPANVESLVLTGAGTITGTGNSGGNTIVGNSAANVLDGGAGADMLVGGAGDDVYVVDNSGDVVVENPGEGNDAIYAAVHYRLAANVDNLVLQGGADLQAYGNTLTNVITGNSGNDLLDGGAGADLLSGGAGDDVYFVDDAGDSVLESSAGGNDVVFATTHFALSPNVETLVLQGTADLQGYGNELVNTLFGNAGSNLLSGLAGADVMYGGAGNDVYFVDDAGDVAIENPGEGSDAVLSTANFGLAADVEALVLQGGADLQGYGNGQANTVYGNIGNNLLNGGAGADIMIGGAGNDTYFVDNGGDQIIENASEGADAVFSTVDYTLSPNVETLVLQGSGNLAGNGNALANSLHGNSGDNVLDGQGGADILTGYAGNDAFVFDIGQADGDTIVDFAGNDAAAGDSLEFVGYGAGASFTNIDATHWQVNYNGGTAHEIIAFMNGAAIDASDVLFV